MDLDGYLARLGFDHVPAPTLGTLRALHRAHVERIAYETYDLFLRRAPGIDPAGSVARLAAGRGGFCYHLNGAFAALLNGLGFRVTMHRAGVQRHDQPSPGVNGGHLALTLSGLPSAAAPEGGWLIDVGLGDALHEPVPLRFGAHRQGPFEYRLRPSEVVAGGWRFDHDPTGTFVGFDFARIPATIEDFAEISTFLSTSPDSPFVRMPLAERRHASGVDMLVGCVLTRIDAAGRREDVVDERDAWFHLLGTRFGLTFTELDAEVRRELWRRVRAGHAAYLVNLAARG